MTNYEWLLQMGGEERQAWFDAEHVDDNGAVRSNDGVIAEHACANDVLTRKGDVRADGVCANDVDATQDSREKLEAEVSNFGFIMNLEGYQLDMIHGWLNRQAAITERELCKQCDWPSLAAQPDYESQGRIVALTDKVDELTAERDALADDLLACNKEREEYRELFSEALTLAAEIVNLQP